MTFPDLLEWLNKGAARQEGKIYLVGGCVRDGLLGRPLVDVDLAIEGDARAYAHRIASTMNGTYVPLGERHGVARVVLSEKAQGVQQVDCATIEGDILDDLARRDFTVDAMAVDVASFNGNWSQATILDPYNGRRDLAVGTLRMVGPQVLEADPLRLLRGVRLMAEIGLRLEEETATAIKERAQRLTACAPERLREELCRILAAESAAIWIAELDSLGLLDVLLPELAEGKGVLQPKEHHWDVFRHQVETVAAVEALVERRVPGGLAAPERAYLEAGARSGPWHPALEGYFQGQIGNLTRKTLLKLTALLHDVAKPATKTFEASGRMRFFGHAEVGADVAGKILARLHFSNRETEAVTRMVANHLRPGQWSDGSVPTQRAVHRYFRDLGDVAIDNIFLNMADHLAARGPGLDPLHWQQHVGVADQVLAQHFQQQERTVSPRLATGNDLMKAFSLKPGPQVGRLLVEIEEAQASGEVATKEEALALAQRCLSRVSP